MVFFGVLALFFSSCREFPQWIRCVQCSVEIGCGSLTSRWLRVNLGDTDEPPGFRFHSMGTAFDLYVNGEWIASAGEMGTPRKTSEPEWLPQVAPINASTAIRAHSIWTFRRPTSIIAREDRSKLSSWVVLTIFALAEKWQSPSASPKSASAHITPDSPGVV